MSGMICEDCDEEMIEAVVECFEEPIFMWRRAIKLYGITVASCSCGPAPIYPKLGRLAQLLKVHTQTADFYYDGADWSPKMDRDAHLGAVEA